MLTRRQVLLGAGAAVVLTSVPLAVAEPKRWHGDYDALRIWLDANDDSVSLEAINDVVCWLKAEGLWASIPQCFVHGGHLVWFESGGRTIWHYRVRL